MRIAICDDEPALLETLEKLFPLPVLSLAFSAAGAVVPAVRLLRRRSDRRIAVYQNKLLARQIAEVQNVYLTMRCRRHDYHNHLQTLKARLDMGRTPHGYPPNGATTATASSASAAWWKSMAATSTSRMSRVCLPQKYCCRCEGRTATGRV